MFKLELKYKKFKLEQEEGGSMFDEQWQFAVEVEREYAQYRKKVMMRYHLSAAEVDIFCRMIRFPLSGAARESRIQKI